MRLLRSNTKAIERACRTIQRLEDYKKKLSEFIRGLTPGSPPRQSARLPSMFLTHFTDLKSASKIIHDNRLKVNERGYLSLTELSPLEFFTITQSKRKYGFGFFKEDLLAQRRDLYSPIAYSRESDLVKQLQHCSQTLAEKLLCEPTNTQASLSFMNQMEVRCSSSIPLEMASLFFREKQIDSGPAQSLNDLGIFQLPHRAAWFRDYFILTQQWYYKEDGDYVEFYDTRHEVISSGEVIAKLQAIKS